MTVTATNGKGIDIARMELGAALELYPYYDAPRVHSVEEFGGNIDAAVIADKLFSRWAGLANLAEYANWENEERNAAQWQAWRDLCDFRTGYSNDASTGKRVVAVGNRDGVQAFDGASFSDQFHEVMSSGRPA